VHEAESKPVRFNGVVGRGRPVSPRHRCGSPRRRMACDPVQQALRIGCARIHWRGLHYAIVQAADIEKPNGEIYRNTEANWIWLDARLSIGLDVEIPDAEDIEPLPIATSSCRTSRCPGPRSNSTLTGMPWCRSTTIGWARPRRCSSTSHTANEVSYERSTSG
jgi:hypothetical protein